MFGTGKRVTMPLPEEAPTGRDTPLPVPERHFVNGRSLTPPYPDGLALALFGFGCFWGAERLFWSLEGVYVTAVGYAGGYTRNPTYDEVCSGSTGHAEVVRVIYDPKRIRYEDLLRIFWESHDPTQGMRQGNDVGTQYRSVIFTYDNGQRRAALASSEAFGKCLEAAGKGPITTQILDAPTFFFAEGYHQQYLAKNPGGYCGLGATGVSCPAL